MIIPLKNQKDVTALKQVSVPAKYQTNLSQIIAIEMTGQNNHTDGTNQHDKSEGTKLSLNVQI